MPPQQIQVILLLPSLLSILFTVIQPPLHLICNSDSIPLVDIDGDDDDALILNKLGSIIIKFYLQKLSSSQQVSK